MRPAERQDHGVAGTTAAGELLVGGIAVALHDAAVAGEQSGGMLGAASGRVGIDDPRRAGITAPGAVVAGNRPEIATFGAAAARIEHRRAGLVDKQPRRAEQDFP